MKRFPVPDKIKEFASVFASNGHVLYIVGGAVRDFLLGVENSDFDFCTDALASEVSSMFRHVIPTGIKHGTVTVLFKGESYEVTTFRKEGAYLDKRHPESVCFVKDLHEDLSRRDFTINAFAADCTDGSITDIFNGMSDLKDGIIRAIGNPVSRFSEDALRLLRMCRFCSKLSFRPEDKTFEASRTLASSIEYVSQERICDELFKTLMSRKPSIGFRLMLDTGLLGHILPELEKCCSIEQDKKGCANVFDHVMLAVDAAASYGYSLEVRLSALLHDIAKPVVVKSCGEALVFYGHDISGAKMARNILSRLKCSNHLIDIVSVLISNHMTVYQPTWTDGAVKRFVNRVGRDNVERLFELKWCDEIATCGRVDLEETDALSQRIRQTENQPMTVKDLAVDGSDLFLAGIPKSKAMGTVLSTLLEEVLDDASLNKKERLLERALEMFSTLDNN